MFAVLVSHERAGYRQLECVHPNKWVKKSCLESSWWQRCQLAFWSGWIQGWLKKLQGVIYFHGFLKQCSRTIDTEKTQRFVDLIRVFLLAEISTPHTCFSLFFRLLIAALSSVQTCPSYRKISNFLWPIIIIAWFIQTHLVHMKKTRTVTENRK